MASPVISIGTASVQEGNSGYRYLEFTVSLSEAASSNVGMSVRTIDGTARKGSNLDYQDQVSSVTIQAGQTSATLLVRVDGDSTDERDETLTVELYNPTGGAVFAGGGNTLRATGIILDDDGGSLADNRVLTVSNVDVVEGDAGTRQAVFEVRLSRPLDAAATFAYTTVDAGARAGSDYVAKSGTLTFQPGQLVAQVAVDVRGDRAVEPSELFHLAVIPNAPEIAAALGTATILDDDAGGGGPVISIGAASVQEGNSGYRYLEFTVSLSEAASSNVGMSVRTIDGTARKGSNLDYQDQVSSVTIQAGQTSATLLVRVDGDSTDERDETLTVELYNPTGGAVFAGGGNTLRATGIILDDDGGSLADNLALTVSNVDVVEGDAGTRQAVFEVRLSRPLDAAATFAYTTVDAGARAGSDYVAKSGTLTFQPGQLVAQVAVDVRGDRAVEPSELFHLAVIPNAPEIAAALGTATILDDDAGGGGPVISIGAASVQEGNSGYRYLEFTVSLSEAASSNIGMSVRTIDGTARKGSNLDYQDQVSSVTIQAGQTSATLLVRVDGDYTDEANETLTVELYNPTGGAAFAGGGNTLRAIGTIIDDDGSPAVSGTAGADNLDGTPVADTLVGLSGNDRVDGDAGDDLLDGGPGDDTLLGGDGLDTLRGGVGNDSLDGGGAADRMEGDAGNDRYLVDSAFDLVIEGASAGVDLVVASVSYTLPDNVEQVTLTGSTAVNGTGNGLANRLTGNAAANRLNGLAGADTLNGLAGADTMAGGIGNDTYIIDNAGDRVLEGAGAGLDTVQSSVPHTLSANVENLTLTGSAAIRGTGNGLGNTLTGNGAANLLNGLGGNDLLKGLGGTDRLDGGVGNDTLIGAAGADTLIGGQGKDVFLYAAAADSTAARTDLITDFDANTFGDGPGGAPGAGAGPATNWNGDVLRFNVVGAQVAAGVVVAVEADAAAAVAAIATLGGLADARFVAALDAGSGRLYADRNSDGQVDSVIQLAGLTTLTAAAIDLV